MKGKGRPTTNIVCVVFFFISKDLISGRRVFFPGVFVFESDEHVLVNPKKKAGGRSGGGDDEVAT